MTASFDNLTADPLDILLKHNHWATRRVLQFCEEIPAERFHEQFDIGLRSLHDTMTHVISAMLRWADRIDGRPVRHSLEIPEGSSWSFFGPASDGPKPAVPRRRLSELNELLDTAATDLESVAERCRTRGLQTTFVLPFGDKHYTFTYGAALTHVTTHGMHHRSQCLNILRRVGAPSLAKETPEIGVVDWQAEIETKQMAPYTPSQH